MKSILISIQPQWVEKILNGKKTIEIRKTKPSCELPCKVYIYCTNSGRPLVYGQENACVQEHYTRTYGYNKKEADKIWGILNGKVVAEFTLNKVEIIPAVKEKRNGANYQYHIISKDILNKSYLKQEEILEYTNGKDLYAWHIDNLKIYDKPKELSEFRKDLDCDDYPCNKNCDCKYNYYDYGEGCWACGIDFDGANCIYKQIKRPPQSWCYVE